MGSGNKNFVHTQSVGVQIEDNLLHAQRIETSPQVEPRDERRVNPCLYTLHKDLSHDIIRLFAPRELVQGGMQMVHIDKRIVR